MRTESEKVLAIVKLIQKRFPHMNTADVVKLSADILQAMKD